jgi:hypothetical protein
MPLQKNVVNGDAANHVAVLRTGVDVVLVRKTMKVFKQSFIVLCQHRLGKKGGVRSFVVIENAHEKPNVGDDQRSAFAAKQPCATECLCRSTGYAALPTTSEGFALANNVGIGSVAYNGTDKNRVVINVLYLPRNCVFVERVDDEEGGNTVVLLGVFEPPLLIVHANDSAPFRVKDCRSYSLRFLVVHGVVTPGGEHGHIEALRETTPLVQMIHVSPLSVR